MTAASTEHHDEPQKPPSRRPLALDEPDPATATLDDWLAHRRRLAMLDLTDRTVRVAIAVADAWIARLRRKPSGE